MPNHEHGQQVSQDPITAYLQRAPTHVLTIYATSLAFITYFCMYAVRKPFTVATFEGLAFFGTQIEVKTAIVLSQIMGYTASKFIGIRVCSELGARYRAVTLVGLIVAAELALCLFAVSDVNWRVLPIFVNGLCLGMIWGLVVLYLEGRSTSEILLAGLSCSYIIASGVVKDAGRWVLHLGFSESWMPAVTGLPFVILLVPVVYFLNKVPPPTPRDVELRVQRVPMSANDRWRFFTRFSLGMIVATVFYVCLTAYRDFRDIYGQEIFEEMGYGETPGIFSMTELPIAFGVMFSLTLINWIQAPRAGMIAVFSLLIFGMALIGLASLLREMNLISGVVWMILTGLGGYLAYVPFGSVLFDRVIASTRHVGTAVFAIYVVDAFGYVGSVSLQLYKDFVAADATRLDFFRGYSYFMSVFGILCCIVCCIYFDRKSRPESQDA